MNAAALVGAWGRQRPCRQPHPPLARSVPEASSSHRSPPSSAPGSGSQSEPYRRSVMATSEGPLPTPPHGIRPRGSAGPIPSGLQSGPQPHRADLRQAEAPNADRCCSHRARSLRRHPRRLHPIHARRGSQLPHRSRIPRRLGRCCLIWHRSNQSPN